MTRPVGEQLEPLERELRSAPAAVRDAVLRLVVRALRRACAERGQSLQDSHRAAVRLRVLQAERWRFAPSSALPARPVENPRHPCDREAE